MRLFWLIFLLCSASLATAQDFEAYCKKNIKGKVRTKKRKNICWCVDDNLRTQLSVEDREWLMRQGVVSKKGEESHRQVASDEPNESGKKRIKNVEFQVFKNCSTNYKWKGNSDDMGVPDDITAP